MTNKILNNNLKKAQIPEVNNSLKAQKTLCVFSEFITIIKLINWESTADKHVILNGLRGSGCFIFKHSAWDRAMMQAFHICSSCLIINRDHHPSLGLKQSHKIMLQLLHVLN